MIYQDQTIPIYQLLHWLRSFCHVDSVASFPRALRFELAFSVALLRFRASNSHSRSLRSLVLSDSRSYSRSLRSLVLCASLSHSRSLRSLVLCASCSHSLLLRSLGLCDLHSHQRLRFALACAAARRLTIIIKALVIRLSINFYYHYQCRYFY